MNVFISFTEVHNFYFEELSVSVVTIKKKLSQTEYIPYEKFQLDCNGKILKDSDNITDGISIIRATFQNAIQGGKGGFGAMLRRKAKEAGPKKTVTEILLRNTITLYQFF